MTDRNESRLMPAIAAGVMSSDTMHAQLLQSIVDSARMIFMAKAASIMLYDKTSHELVFEAVSGEGQGRIIGFRMPAASGIAGWVLTSGEAMIVEDLHWAEPGLLDLLETLVAPLLYVVLALEPEDEREILELHEIDVPRRLL